MDADTVQALRDANQGAHMSSSKTLEINPEHALIQNLRRLHALAPDSERLVEWTEVLHDQVLLTEGSPVQDPNRLARRMTSLLQQACAAEVTAQG